MTLESLSTARLRTLVDGAAAVAGQTDLDALLDVTVSTAMELTGARYGALGVVGEHGTLTRFIHHGLDDETAKRIGHPPEGRGVLGLITKTGEAYRLDKIADHPDSHGFPPHHPLMESFLGVPVRAGTSIFGNLYLTDKPDGFTDDDQSVVEALALLAGSAVNSLRLQIRLRRVAVAEDRERIARDIHDAIIQDLFAVGLSLQGRALNVADDELRDSLLHNAQRLDEAIASLRQFIFDLHRPAAGDRDLRTEVEDLVLRLSDPHDTAVELSMNGSFTGVPSPIIDDVLQIVRESVSNALRHSGAAVVRVALNESADAIGITVEDDGQGFDLESTSPGLGLANLASRAERSDGEIRIDTSPGNGTTVRARIPYD